MKEDEQKMTGFTTTGMARPEILPQKLPFFFRTHHKQSTRTFPKGLVNDFSDLSSKNRLKFIFELSRKNDDEFKTMSRIIASLLKTGIVGYEYLDVRNKPYKSFITTRIGDHRLHGARLYKRGTLLI